MQYISSLLVTAFCATSVFHSHGLDCHQLTTYYVCFNKESAELCEALPYCQRLWRNENIKKSTSGIVHPANSSRLILHRSSSRTVPNNILEKIANLRQKHQTQGDPNFDNWDYSEFFELYDELTNSTASTDQTIPKPPGLNRENPHLILHQSPGRKLPVKVVDSFITIFRRHHHTVDPNFDNWDYSEFSEIHEATSDKTDSMDATITQPSSDFDNWDYDEFHEIDDKAATANGSLDASGTAEQRTTTMRALNETDGMTGDPNFDNWDYSEFFEVRNEERSYEESINTTATPLNKPLDSFVALSHKRGRDQTKGEEFDSWNFDDLHEIHSPTGDNSFDVALRSSIRTESGWHRVPSSLLPMNSSAVPDEPVTPEAFNSSIIILTSMTGLLTSRWNTSSAIEEPNSISVYYHCPECQNGDYLVIAEDGLTPAEYAYVYHIKSISAFLATDLRPRHYLTTIPAGNAHSMAFPHFQARIYRDGRIMKSAAAWNGYNWMEYLRSSLQYLTIPELFIPGTHQSGTCLCPQSHQGIMKSLTSRWTSCQSTTITEQLYNGIRYLDLRVLCHKVNNRCQDYYLHHGGIEMMQMKDVVEQVNSFLDQTEEIVILSFKQFGKGFDSDEDHDGFMAYLNRQFWANILPRTILMWNTPLSVLWSRNMRLVISYNHASYINSGLWPPIHQYWCNKRTFEELHDCLGAFNNQKSPHYIIEPTVDMVQLTHDWKSLVADAVRWSTDSSIRSWANRLNPYILKWYYEQWNATANIIAVDFFEITGIVELAIHLNTRRASKRRYGRRTQIGRRHKRP